MEPGPRDPVRALVLDVIGSQHANRAVLHMSRTAGAGYVFTLPSELLSEAPMIERITHQHDADRPDGFYIDGTAIKYCVGPVIACGHWCADSADRNRLEASCCCCNRSDGYACSFCRQAMARIARTQHGRGRRA